MSKSVSKRPETIDQAIDRGRRGVGAGTIGGQVICPYSRDDKEHYWAWIGAYEAVHGRR